MLLIKSYNERYRQQWDDFVMNSDTSSLFHLTAWKDAVERVFGHKSHYLMAVRDERVEGILPLFEMKSLLFGHALVSVPYGVQGGISAHDDDSFEMLKNSAENLADLIHVDYLELRQPVKNAGGVQFEQAERPNERRDRTSETIGHHVEHKWLSKDLYVNFRRPIAQSVEENFDLIPRKQRRMIKQGMKHGLTSSVEGIDRMEEFYSIYAQSVRNLGSPVYPLAFFMELMKAFRESFILAVWKETKMVAGVLAFAHKDTLMPYYGGGLKEYFQYAINDFMYWELMKYGCENGYKVFDFGRSKRDTGPYHFKRHWGFEPQGSNYDYYLVKAKRLPNVSPANPRYKFFINVWKRLPLSFTNWLGPKLVRGIP
jgi:FemAB-related protein (PEP-CTERM system-associated)